ncbi:MAG: hypothetical protein V3S22_02160 [Candidatus Neomarinimicrobiota bacterium]
MSTAIIECEKCGETKELKQDLSCTACLKPEHLNPGLDFSVCPVCGCGQFYRKKDFNQALGCSIILVGAVLVPLTYGLSMVVFSLLDYFLYRRIKDSAACYKCRSEFKGISLGDNLEPFNHHVAEIYE